MREMREMREMRAVDYRTAATGTAPAVCRVSSDSGNWAARGRPECVRSCRPRTLSRHVMSCQYNFAWLSIRTFNTFTVYVYIYTSCNHRFKPYRSRLSG